VTRSLADRLGASPPVLALSMARLADAVGNSILFVVIPLYVAKLPSHFAIPESVRVGLLISLYGLVNTACQPVMGALSDRLGMRKPMIQAGLLLMAAATLSYMAAQTYLQLVLLRAAQGIAVAVTIPAALALMAGITRKETRGAAMGVYSTTRMIGFAVGPLMGGVVYEHLGFDATFITGAAFLLLGFLMVQIWVREVRAAPAPDETAPRFRIIDRSLLTGGVLGAGFATFVMAADFSMLAALENQFNARLEQTAIGFAMAFSALMLSRLLFQIPLGRLSDRIGRRPLIVAGLLLLAPSTALLGMAATTAQLTGLRLLQGVASAGVAAPAFALVADQSRAGGEGRQMAIVTMGFGLGIALGPLIGGTLAVIFFELPFLAAGVATAIAAVLVHRYVPETVAARE
jgi:MFS family permease